MCPSGALADNQETTNCTSNPCVDGAADDALCCMSAQPASTTSATLAPTPPPHLHTPSPTSSTSADDQDTTASTTPVHATVAPTPSPHLQTPLPTPSAEPVSASV